MKRQNYKSRHNEVKGLKWKQLVKWVICWNYAIELNEHVKLPDIDRWKWETCQ